MRKIAIFLSIISIFLISGIIVRAALPTQVNVIVSSSFDRTNKGINHTIPPVNYGAEITINGANLHSTYNFQFWMLNGVVREDLPANLTIKARTNMNLHAVFSKNGEHAVLFVDSNGKLISLVYVADNQAVIAPSYTGYTKPGQTVNTTTPWKMLDGTSTLTNINSSRVYVLQYTNLVQEVTITLNNATVSALLKNINEVVTVTTSNAGAFKYWKNDSDEVVSFKPSFSFTATKDITLTAELVDDTKSAANLVTISQDLEIRAGYNTYVGRFELLPGNTIHEFGFLVSNTDSDVDFDSSDVQIVKSNAYNQLTNEFIMSFSIGSYMSVKAYIVVDTGTILNEITSLANRTTTLSGVTTDLIISEYVEGLSNNKAIELFNGTNSTISLTGYSILIYANGGTSASNTISLTGTVPVNGTFVLAHSSANATILALANQTSASLNFNGNDAIELRKNGSLVDSFGQVGNNPGDPGWSGLTTDKTLVRNSNISTGRLISNSVFNPNIEWTVFDNETTSNLGAHTFTGAVSMSSSTKAQLDLNSISLPETKKNNTGISLNLTGSYGSSISYYSDSPDTVAVNGSTLNVTLPSGQPITVIITVKVVNDASVLTKEFEIVVGLTDQEKVSADKDALSVETVFVEPDVLDLPNIGTNGSNIVWQSSNEDLINSTTGEVSIPLSGQELVILTATISIGAIEETREFEITLGSSGAAPESFTETFDNLALTGTSYTNGNHTGVNGQYWSYTLSRGDQTLVGKALTTQTGVITTTFTNGLSKLEFDYVRAFTGTSARSFTVKINGVLIDTITVSPTSDIVLRYVSANLNYKGNVTVEITGFGAQKKIDNILWTTNP